MARMSFSGFTDPVRRPRYIIWTVVAVLAIITVMIPVLGITSTRWFCSNGCHKVQDDTITAYRRSSHSEVSCMACHMPVNANPVIFLIHKAEALGELYMTVTNNFELPLNAESEVALTMKSTQCTQCHDESKRPVTPDAGLKINHEVHAKNGVDCTVCHNRIAHREDFDLTLKDPSTRQPNQKHQDFMKMTACFRCHTQDYQGTNKPTGACAACHTPDFQLKPASHLAAGFFPKGHGAMGAAEDSRTIQVGGVSWLNGAETSGAAGQPETRKNNETLGQSLPKADSVNYCSMCHAKKFCIDCHGGVTMPHPQDWTQHHGKIGKQFPNSCAKCHGTGTAACDACHHGTTIEFAYKAAIPWRQQHPTAVNAVGAATCLATCHDPTFCSDCHANGGISPK